MICPHCSIEMHPVPTGMMRSPSQLFYKDREGGHHRVEAAGCPSCAGVFLTHSDTEFLQGRPWRARRR